MDGADRTDLPLPAGSPGNDPERQNLYRAVQYGLGLSEAWPLVADVALQSTPFVRRRMLGSEWVPILGKLLARCPENDLRRRFKLLIRLGQLHRLNMKLESARSTLQEAEVAAGRLDDKNAQAETTYNLCRNYWRGRQYAEAERCARATLEILSDFEGAEAWLLAEGNRMLGVIADRRGELDKAEAFLR